MGDRLRAGKPPQYFTEPPRPTQPSTLSRTGIEYRQECDDALRLGKKGRMAHYLQQGGYVIVVVCLFVCLVATLRKNFATDLQGRLAIEQMIKVWWRSESRIRIRIATLVRRALAEVCTVPVLLVILSENADTY